MNAVGQLQFVENFLRWNRLDLLGRVRLRDGNVNGDAEQFAFDDGDGDGTVIGRRRAENQFRLGLRQMIRRRMNRNVTVDDLKVRRFEERRFVRRARRRRGGKISFR